MQPWFDDNVSAITPSLLSRVELQQVNLVVCTDQTILNLSPVHSWLNQQGDVFFLKDSIIVQDSKSRLPFSSTSGQHWLPVCTTFWLLARRWGRWRRWQIFRAKGVALFEGLARWHWRHDGWRKIWPSPGMVLDGFGVPTNRNFNKQSMRNIEKPWDEMGRNRFSKLMTSLETLVETFGILCTESLTLLRARLRWWISIRTAHVVQSSIYIYISIYHHKSSYQLLRQTQNSIANCEFGNTWGRDAASSCGELDWELKHAWTISWES